MLNEEEIKDIKKQIISQIDSWHASDEQKKQAKQQIEEMPAEELEAFLAKNKIISETKGKEDKTECVFCSIIQGKIH